MPGRSVRLAPVRSGRKGTSPNQASVSKGKRSGFAWYGSWLEKDEKDDVGNLGCLAVSQLVVLLCNHDG